MLDRNNGDAVFRVYSFQQSVYLFLAVDIHTGRGLVQNQQVRVSHQRPRDQYFLVLPSGEGAHQALQNPTFDLLKIFPDYVFVFDAQ